MRPTTARQRPRRRSFARWFLAALASLAALCGVGLGYLLLTPSGAEALTRLVLAKYVGLHRITIQRVKGSLIAGFTAKGVRIQDVLEKEPGSVLEIDQARMAALSSWKVLGPVFTAQNIRLHPSPLAQALTAAYANGSVLGGIVFHEIHFQDIRRLPAGSMLDIQELDTGWPISLRRLRSIQNGRLRLTSSEPIVFFGQRQEGRVEARLFSKALDVREILAAANASKDLVLSIQGSIDDFNLAVKRTDGDWLLNGTFQIERLARRGMLLTNTAGNLHLQVQAMPWRVIGQVHCWGGTVAAKQVVIAVRPSLFSFAGDPLTPSFDLKGSSTVGMTKIHVSLKGTKAAPQMVLTSEPPLAQETLLIMLVTGKSYTGARQALQEGEISSELAVDFIDYVFFGGVGNRMARRFGITDFAITQNLERNTVGAQTTFVNRVTFDVEVDPRRRGGGGTTAAPAPVRPSAPYRVGAEYQVTDKTAVRLEGERNPIEPKPSAPAQASGTAESAPTTDDTVVLKVKRRF